MAVQRRLTAAFVGGMVGSVLGVFVMAIMVGAAHINGLLCGVGFAIAGAITDQDRRLILAAAICAVIGWFPASALAASQGSPYAIAAGGILGAPIGAVVGAVIGRMQRKNA